jgi:hypothetical protein
MVFHRGLCSKLIKLKNLAPGYEEREDRGKVVTDMDIAKVPLWSFLARYTTLKMDA